MKRRKAIRQLGMGVAGSWLLPGVLSQCAPADPGPEVNYPGTVAIIGAGAAGLYVADILRAKGIKVVIYEAGNQIGGRVKSLRNQSTEAYPNSPLMSSDFPLELGADTYIGTDSTLGKIVQVYGLRTTEFPAEANHFVMDNQALSAADWGGDPDFAAAIAFRQNLASLAGSAQSVQQAVASAGISSRAHSMLNGMIGNTYGADNDLAGAGGIGEEEALRVGDDNVFVLTANPLQDLLISRFNSVVSSVKLNTAITSIQYGADPIVLTGSDGTTYQADKVIVTVPVSVLKGGGLGFSPALPSTHTASLAKIGMGASFRAIVEFKRNFWGETTGFIFGSTNVPEFMSAGLSRSTFNATLQITVNGARALTYSSLGEGAIQSILADLDSLYKDPVTLAGYGTQFVRRKVDPLTSTETDPIWLKEDWTTREHILGGYSYPLPGATNNDRKNIGQPVSGKLFFAGEATDITGNAGMINGALASAERCAEEVVKSILGTA